MGRKDISPVCIGHKSGDTTTVAVDTGNVIPEGELSETAIAVEGHMNANLNSEKYFKILGLHNFFNAKEDSNIHWEEVFGLKDEAIEFMISSFFKNTR